MDKKLLLEQWKKDNPEGLFNIACACMGPWDDEPYCPCQMRWIIKDCDKYYRVKEVITYEIEDIPQEEIDQIFEQRRKNQEILDRLDEEFELEEKRKDIQFRLQEYKEKKRSRSSVD